VTAKNIKAIAVKLLAMKPEFDYARDEDSNRVSDTQFCMISRSEWRDVRAVAAALALPKKPKRKTRRLTRGR
jgi:hypothetical protein